MESRIGRKPSLMTLSILASWLSASLDELVAGLPGAKGKASIRRKSEVVVEAQSRMVVDTSVSAPHQRIDGRKHRYDHYRSRLLEVMTTSRHRAGTAIRASDPRIGRAVFTLREAAGYLGLPPSTLHNWARPAGGTMPVITCFPARGREATVPFIGFAEAYVLSAFRRAGVPMQRIRPAVEVLSSGIGVEHALASKQLYTDGAEVLYDYAASEQDEELRGLTVVRTGQRQFAEVVRDYLKRVTYGDDGWASRVRLPVYQQAQVIVDPRRAFGMPFVVHGGARVEDLVDRFVAGDTLADIAEDFGVPEPEVEDVVRVATRAAA